ncbi:MAG: patatin-like phospholipase family protein [Candidatus Edwardsbacteria bacterium]|nr:patatin-like phospholipase family protein [Candidatus Edwardsbacteria bacterium]
MKNKIGLALSGGVGYCLAHIGVLKVIEEQGIEIDCVAGTSGGAMIGALYASGIKAERMKQIASAISWQNLMAPTRILTNKGLVSSEPIERLVDELIGRGRRLGELKRPLSVVAVDALKKLKAGTTIGVVFATGRYEPDQPVRNRRPLDEPGHACVPAH